MAELGGRRLQRLSNRAASILFLCLGCNYLLPFNTVMNLYTFYREEKRLLDGTNLFISLTNIFYQLASIVINIAAVFMPRGNTKCNISVLEFSIGSSCVILVILSLVGLIKEINGSAFMASSIGATTLMSVFQSVGDTAALFLCKFFDHRALLNYAAGINISGTAQAGIYIILQWMGRDNIRVVAVLYYILTATFLGIVIPIVARSFRGLTDSEIDVVSVGANMRRCISRVKLYALATVINFGLTLFIYPQMLLRAAPLLDVPFYNGFFIFLNFNACALLGNIVARYYPTGRLCHIQILLCIRLFISPIFVCHQYDSFYSYVAAHYRISFSILLIAFTMFFAFSSAYISSCCFYTAGKVSDPADVVHAVRIINLSVSLGLVLGTACASLFFAFK